VVNYKGRDGMAATTLDDYVEIAEAC